MSFQRDDDEVDVIDATYIIDPEQADRSRNESGYNLEEEVSGASSLPVLSEMTSPVGGRHQTMVLSTPKGQASWDEIEEGKEKTKEGGEEKLTNDEAKEEIS